ECPDADACCPGFDGGSGNAPPDAIRARLVALLDAVEKATGFVPILYTSNSYFSGNRVNTDGFARYPLYIANPIDGLAQTSCLHFPEPWEKAQFWQWSWKGRIAGIAGDVDRDRFVGTRDDLAKLGKGRGATRFEQQPDPWIAGLEKPDWAAAGDFDGDGKSDVLVYDGGAHAFTLLRSTGAKLESAGTWLDGFGSADWAAVADFDGDGK